MSGCFSQIIIRTGCTELVFDRLIELVFEGRGMDLGGRRRADAVRLTDKSLNERYVQLIAVSNNPRSILISLDDFRRAMK